MNTQFTLVPIVFAIEQLDGVTIARKTQPDGTFAWSVYDMGDVLNDQGAFELEPSVESPDFVSRCRMPSKKAAMKRAKTFLLK